MQSLFQQITEQLAFNAQANLFCDPAGSAFRFSPDTKDFLTENQALLGQLSPEELDKLIHFTTGQVLALLYQINQYYSFNQNDIKKLEDIYNTLFQDFQHLSNPSINTELENLASAHYIRLQNWLRHTNQFAEQIFKPEEPYLQKTIVCAEYAPEIQLKLLNIDLQNIKEPILDLGCGSEARLVHYLRGLGLEAFGIDRSAEAQDFVTKTDWFDCTFDPEYWGTIISNLSFSNQFVHHHHRPDGNFLAYARKYMEILRSLQPGGSFYYAPDLPFIEMYLDTSQFKMEKKSVAQTGNFAVKLLKIKP